MEEKKLVPKLRFPGFTEPWEQRKLGEITVRVKGNDGRMDLPTLTISAAEGWLDQHDRFSTNIAGNEQKNYTLLHRGELSYNHGNSKNAKYGVVFVLSDYTEALVPKVYHSFKVKNNNYNPYFIEYYFATKRPDKELCKLISSGARMDGLLNIGYEDFVNIAIKIPLLTEQSLIVECLNKVNTLLTLHQRKLEHLKLKKKSLLQKLFPKEGEVYPELRFPGFTDPWEQRKLGEMASFSKGNGYFKSDLKSTGIPIILYGRLYTKYETVIKDIDTFADAKEGAVYSLGGEVIVPASGETAEDISIASVVQNPGVLLGGDLNIIRPIENLLPAFLALSISNGSSHREMSKRAQGKSVVHLHNEDLGQIDLKYPSVEEQSKITVCINWIDTLITLHQRKLEHLQLLKKALLQQLFV